MRQNNKQMPVRVMQDEPLAELMDRNFLNYASYVICDRAIPSITDGLKPVQRRIMHALYEMDDGRFIKVANVVGNTMQYHPHGDASIGDALVNLANRGFLIEKQGNFGNIHTGDPAAAPRYIECRLTQMARDQLFNKNITDYVPSYDGRNMEPVELPGKLPLLLMMGAEGVAVGMATRILPHNTGELINAQIDIVNGKQVRLLPDFPQGGLMDPADYDEGQGTVRVRARFDDTVENTLLITEIPYGTNTDSLAASIADAVSLRKLPIDSINNYTAEKVNIELILKPQADKQKVIRKLYAFTQCEVVLNSSIIVLKDKRPVKLKPHELLHENTQQLINVLKKELLFQKKSISEELHMRTLQQIFIEEKVYQTLEQCVSEDAVSRIVKERMMHYKAEFLRDVTDQDIQKLLTIRIRRISGYDREKSAKSIKKLNDELQKIDRRLQNLKAHVLGTLRKMKKEYCESSKRRTEITSFDQTNRKELTADELRIAYDRKSGYIGTKVQNEKSMDCSPYDKIVMMWGDGRCKTLRPFDKLFADTDLIYFGKVSARKVMTVVYCMDGFTYVKRFKFSGSRMDKPFRCTPKGATVIFASDIKPEKLYIKYQPYKGMLIAQQYFETKDVPVKQIQTGGKQMTSKSISKISVELPKWWDQNGKIQRGTFMDMF